MKSVSLIRKARSRDQFSEYVDGEINVSCCLEPQHGLLLSLCCLNLFDSSMITYYMLTLRETGD